MHKHSLIKVCSREYLIRRHMPEEMLCERVSNRCKVDDNEHHAAGDTLGDAGDVPRGTDGDADCGVVLVPKLQEMS